MMDSGYRLVFCGRTVYNEIDVESGTDIVGIGTFAGCQARFSKEHFSQSFLVVVSKTASGWHLSCEYGVYFKYNSQNVFQVDVQQGDYVPLYSSSSKEELFKLGCLTNYEEASTICDACLSLNGRQQLVIGNSVDADLCLTHLRESEECFKLDNSGSYLRLSVIKTSLGVYVNGNRAVGITKIKNHDFISCGPYIMYFREAKLYVSNREHIVSSIPLEPLTESESALVYPKFNRSTRVKRVYSEEPITVLDPPDIPQKPTDSLVMTLLPAVIMIALVIVLRGVLSTSTGTYVIFSVCTMTLGVFTSVMNYRKSQKTYKDALQSRKDTYSSYISRKREEIDLARKQEAEALLENYPCAEDTIARAARFSGSLFDRTLRDEDFLHIRVGTGKRAAMRKIAYKAKDSLVLGDELQVIPEQMEEEYRYLEQSPIVVDLREAGILGVIGTEEDSFAFSRVVVEDLCTRQYSKDAAMVTICTKEQAEGIAWMRYLPHFQSGAGLARNIACDKESCDIQYESLLKTLSLRESLKKNTEFPAIIVFVFDQMGLYTHPLSKYLECAKSLGVYFVFFVRTQEELPLYCGRLVSLRGANQATLIHTEDQAQASDFVYETISSKAMWKMALKLAPVYCEDVSVEGNLPKSFSLFALLGIQGADDLDLKTRWSRADSTQSMAAPLGLRAGGEVISLDLHEKAHGPHGLVAGTTGSGKSELLQSYILSMATLFPPEEVGFVIIDFKGGGMANLFSELPHLVGSITDIDGKAINRSLMSIRAELDKRKRLFAEAEVNNIGAYIKKYKADKHHEMQPLPHLILIIDEFAELKADQPEFMKEVISAARIGRSLGIHLILATQKPAGVIDEQIWSNSRFKLCLKVQSQSDSNEVLKSPLAAEIREPGRAYLQVGNNEIFELFQSAYSGCPAQCEEMDHVEPFALYEVDACGRRKLIFEKKQPSRMNALGQEEQVQTQLGAITEKIVSYCQAEGIQRLPSICLPPLSSELEFVSPQEHSESLGTVIAAIGVYDDPASQAQNTVEVDMSSNNMLIIGAAQSGKTNLMMTMIRSLAARYTPSEVNLYIIDFGPSILSNFQDLPHVGGVVNDNEDEELKNLFKLLNTEIAVRKQKIMAAKVSSLSAYREAGHTDLPWIVLFVDNYTALKELYLADQDILLPICRNGLSVGISVVIANQNIQGIGYRYLSSVSTRIAMYCNDRNDYASVIDHCRIYPDDVPGRGVIAIEKTVYELQVFSCFAGALEKDKVERQTRFIAETKQACKGAHAKPIPMIPEQLTVRQIEQVMAAKTSARYEIGIGLDYESIDVVCLDLMSLGALGVIGKPTVAAGAVIDNVISHLSASESRLYLVDSKKRELLKYKDAEAVREYSSEPARFVEIVNAIYEELKARAEACGRNGYDTLKDQAQIVVIVNGTDQIIAFCKNASAVTKYKEILDRYLDMKVCFLFAFIDNAEVSYNGPEILRRLKDTKNILYFDTLAKLRFVQVSQRALRQAGRIHPLDGFYFSDGEPVRFKAALPE